MGCGANLKKGFINIDLNKSANFRLDLRKPLFFKKNSVEYIYSEHFFEHLNYTDTTAIRCLQNYYKILKTGGKMRLVVPDMEKVFKAYVKRDIEYFKSIKIKEKIPQSKKYASIIDYVNYRVYQFGEHKYSYDYEKIELLLKSVGFKNIIKDDFNPSKDTREQSIFVEAIK